MGSDILPIHGDPEGSVFGIAGQKLNSDLGFSYIKSGSNFDTYKFGWVNDSVIPAASLTPTPSITPTRTPIITRTPPPTPTVTPTQTNTPSSTRITLPVFTQTPTPTISVTPSITPTISSTRAPLPTPSVTPTSGSIPAPTTTTTPQPTPTVTPSRSTYTLTVNINPLGSGYATKDPFFDYYNAGQAITVYASPGSNVTDFSSATSNTSINVQTVTYADGIHGVITFNMPAFDVTLNLNFVPQNRQLIMYKAGSGNGSVSPSEGNYIYPVDTVVNISATADPGSAFTRWVFEGTPDISDGPTIQASSYIKLSTNRSARAFINLRKKVYATVNENGDYRVSYTDLNGIYRTLTGTGTPGESIYVACGVEVSSGGFLSNEEC